MSNIPNTLTLLRIILIPFIVYMVINNYFLGAFSLFVVSSFTDFLDGYLARKWKSVSTLGKLIDPVADKILTSSVLIALTFKNMCDPYSVIAIVAREEAVTGLRAVAASTGVIVPAGNLGKVKTILLMISISLLLLGFSFYGEILLIVSALIALYSGAVYFYNFFKLSGEKI